MLAIQVREFGDPSVLAVQEVPEPDAGEGEVLIEVDAAGVNFGDSLVRQGAYFGGGNLPIVPGWEVVGRIADSRDSGFRVGERVVAMMAAGGYAQRVVAPVKDTVSVPDYISDQVALAMVIQGATAWHLLETPFATRAGESLLVSGAGSGVTHLLVQLAKLRGVERVSVVASSEEKAALVRSLGARAVVCTDNQALAALLIDEIGPESADHVVDMVGSPVFEAMLRCLRPGGRAVVYGAAGGSPSKISTGLMLRYGWTVAGLWLGHEDAEPFSKTLHRLFDLCRDGLLSPTCGPVLPLASAPEAHLILESRAAVGKVMLQVR